MPVGLTATPLRAYNSCRGKENIRQRTVCVLASDKYTRLSLPRPHDDSSRTERRVPVSSSHRSLNGVGERSAPPKQITLLPILAIACPPRAAGADAPRSSCKFTSVFCARTHVGTKCYRRHQHTFGKFQTPIAVCKGPPQAARLSVCS